MKPTVEIRCLHCGQWFRSPIGFGGLGVFDATKMIGNKAQCSHCNAMTDCNKENMRVRGEDGGFVGNDT